MKIVECVPNFSEGRNLDTVRAITAAIEEVESVTLLDVDPGAGANRTVVTFVGPPEAVEEAAFRAMARASDLIDMRAHKGSHPRLGSTDVCPFVPVEGVTLEDCVAMALRLGHRVGSELHIPVYLYEAAARVESRRNLADIRAGEYEGLEARLRDPAWRPDFGPAEPNQRAGATVIGARKFLIAYNVNLNSRRRADAADLALSLREKGRLARDEHGGKIPDGAGGWKRVPGILGACKAVGWVIPEYGRAQISMNLTDPDVTGLAKAFEAADTLARSKGLRVTGSEIVGLVPVEAMLAAGRHFLASRGASRGVPREAVIECAIQSLGLGEVSEFDPAVKVLEARLAGPEGLAHMPVDGFSAEVSTDSPAPGGGSVAALAGALGAALTSMVANLTYGKKGFVEVRQEMEQTAVKAQDLRLKLLEAVDRDTEAFNRVMSALGMPRSTDEERSARTSTLRSANLGAAQVPLDVMGLGVEVLTLALVAAEKGNPGSITDAGVAGLMGRACVVGAYYNVLVNLRGLGEPDLAARLRQESEALRASAERIASRIEARLADSL